MRCPARLIWLTVVPLLSPAPAVGQNSPEPLFIDVRQGTDLSVTSVPGADFMIIELLGRLWRLPVTGGAAQPLTAEGETVRHPRLSADRARVVYQRLGEAGWDELSSASGRALAGVVPAAAGAGLPALSDRDGLLSVPHLGYGRGPEAGSALKKCAFAPENPLAGPRFTVA